MGTESTQDHLQRKVRATKNGNLLWAYQFSGPCNGFYPAVPSAVVDGTLYVMHTPDGSTGELWAFR
jgi:outer membrane protein assembly factor BamB